MSAKTSSSEANNKLAAAQINITSLTTQLSDIKKQQASTSSKQEKEITLLKEEAGLYRERIKLLQAWQDDVSKKEDKKEADRLKREKEIQDKEKAEREREREKEKIEREKRDRAIEELRKRVAELEEDVRKLSDENMKLKENSNHLQELVDSNEDEKLKFEADISKQKKINESHVKERELFKKEEFSLKKSLKDASDEALAAKKVLMEKEAEVIKLIEVKDKLKTDTSAMIENIKQESQGSPKESDDDIDKGVIGSFLINFFESSSNPKVQAELLTTLSKMLNFTSEQKAKIGIQQLKLTKLAEGQPPSKDPSKKSFSDNFISFLTSGD